MAEQEVLYVKSLLYPTKSNSKLPERDSVVGKVLTRNNWSNMVIVADMTASMSPYTAQLLLWLKLNTNSEMVKQFVFFNDGDRALESNKIIGKTGGIYETRSANFEDVEELAYT